MATAAVVSSSSSSSLPPPVPPSCAYGKSCQHPPSELLRQCSDTCTAMIHPICAGTLDRCPFHGNDTAARLNGSIESCPPQRTELFAELQSATYKTAVLKHGAIYDALVTKAKTKGGDNALVIDTPHDGNCLLVALLRGFFNGLPLSPAIQEQAMLLLRGILAEMMRNHQWPHPWISTNHR